MGFFREVFKGYDGAKQYYLACNLMNGDKYEDALIILKDLLANEFNIKYVLRSLVSVYSSLKNYDCALYYADKSLSLYPLDSQELYNKGLVLTELFNYGSALIYFNKSGDNFEGDWKVDFLGESILLAKANTLYYLNCLEGYDDAIHCFDKSLSLNSNFWEALAKIKSFYCSDDLDSAIINAESALKLNPTNVDLLNNLGFFFENKDYINSLDYINKSLDIECNINALLIKARCLKSLNKTNDSLKYYQKVLKFDSENKEVKLVCEKLKKSLNKT